MIQNQYRNAGYVILRGVLSKNDVVSIRQRTDAELKDFKGQRAIDYVLKRKDLWGLSLHPKILKALNDIFGSKVRLINDFDFQINNPKNSKKRSGWHIDAGGQLERLDSMLFDPEYKFAKVGVYLQDNSEEFGGGIDVEVAGHKSFRNFKSKKLSLLYYGLDKSIFSKFRKKIRLDINAGDVVIFDGRLPHASSRPKQNLDDIPNTKRKISLYWSAIGNDNSVAAWRTHQLLGFFDTLNNNQRDFFANVLQYTYPDSYHHEYRKVVESTDGVLIQSPQPEIVSYFKKYCSTNDIREFEIPFETKEAT